MHDSFEEMIHDVREMEAPAPLLTTLKRVEEMDGKSILHMIHRMEPCRLFEELNKRQCHYLMYKNTEGVHILMWKSADPHMADLAKEIRQSGGA